MASFSPEKIEKPFFKIIVDDSISQHKLGIPSNFVLNYGDDLSSPVTLKVPGGLEWKVEIVKSEGEIWLGDGWREFAEYYSVVERSFLVFQYQKCSCEFNVIVFDKTDTETNHPVTIFDNQDQKRARDLDLDLDREPVPQEPLKKVIKLESCEETLDQSGLTDNSKESIEKGSSRKERKPRVAKEKFTPVNPSFQAKISSSCLKKSTVRVPCGLTRKIEPGTEFVRLQFNNRCWSVKLMHYSEKKSYLSAGWAAFATENALKMGDVCTFQLVNNTDGTPLINVSVIRHSDNGVNRDTKPQVVKVEQVPQEPHEKMIERESSAKTLDQSRLTGNSKESIEKGSSRKERKPRETKEATKKFTSVNPSFQAKISSSCLKNKMVRVPYGLTRKIEPGTESVRLQCNNRCWSVKLIHYSEKKSSLSAGWAAFATENALKVGDVCTFQLVNNTDGTPLINVSVIRRSENGVDRDTKPQVVKVEQVPEEPHEKMIERESSAKTLDQSRLTGNRKESIEKGSRRKERKPREAKEATKKFTSANPFFQYKIPPASLDSFMVYVPYRFTRKIEPGTESVMINFNDRCWSVKLIRYSEKRSYLSAGWAAFVRENSLKMGDVCTFEPIHNTDQTPLFNISIIRNSDICSVSNGVDRETEQTTSETPDEVSGQFSYTRKRKENPTLPSVNSQPRKKTKRAENLTKKDGKGKSEQSMRKESGTREGRCLGKPSFSNPPQKSASGNPFFQVVMKSSHLRHRGYNMNVPLHFIKNLHLGTRVARLQADNKVWSVKLIIYPHFAKSVFSGWTRFAMDNALEVGDVCSFEMIDPQKLQIKVSISRDSSDVEFISEKN